MGSVSIHTKKEGGIEMGVSGPPPTLNNGKQNKGEKNDSVKKKPSDIKSNQSNKPNKG